MIRLLLGFVALVWTSLSIGQVPQNFLIEDLPPAATPPTEDIEETAYFIGKKLRCPVCQGLSIADSNAEGAVMIQRRINELVAAGYTEAQIQDYFVDKYGEWIMLEPKPEGLNLLIWIAPVAAGGLGILGLAATSRRNDPLVAPATPRVTSSYEEKLLQELDHDV